MGGGIQLSKRNNDNKLNNITSGSSNGDGIKEYYYKCISSLDNVMIELILSLVNNIEVILPYQGAFLKCANIMLVVDGGLGNAIGFKFLDTPTKALVPDNSGENLISIEFNGDFNNRAIDYGTKLDFTQEQFENALSAINNHFKEITKEEYESMITYKPE